MRPSFWFEFLFRTVCSAVFVFIVVYTALIRSTPVESTEPACECGQGGGP